MIKHYFVNDIRLTEEEIEKIFNRYLSHFTDEPQPPECSKCYKSADVYDSGDGGHFCKPCLKKSLLDDDFEYFIKQTN